VAKEGLYLNSEPRASRLGNLDLQVFIPELKDAKHVIARVAIPAIPSALQLVDNVREKLLAAVGPYAAEREAGERIRIEMIRSSDGAPLLGFGAVG
jgi:hypothetical protein